LWSGQLLHFLALAVLLSLTWFLWIKIGRPFPSLFWLTISVPIVHQIFVWLTWRMELKSQAVSNSMGFKTYLVIFFLLLIGRPLTLFLLARIDQGSLGMENLPRTIISVALFVPAMYILMTHENPNFYKRLFASNGVKIINRSYGYA